MAHDILSIDGRAVMAYYDSTPWHGLGEKLQLRDLVPAAMVDAALDAARLRFKVASVPLHLADGTEITGYKASARLTDAGAVAAILGIVTDAYKHVQNDRAVDVVRVLVEQFAFIPAATGALANGARCWMLLRCADSQLTPVDGDYVNGYALLMWGHDGAISIQFHGVTVRVVCQNTLTMATSGRKAWITIRHTASADARIDQAAKIVQAITQAMHATGETYASMARKQMDRAQIAAFVARVIPNTDATAKTLSPTIARRRDTITRLVHSGRGADLANQLVPTANGGASLWAVYNAISEYFDHVRPAEATNQSGRDRANESALFGANAATKQQAYDDARALLTAN